MLIAKGVDIGDIVTVKLVSGEEIVGRLQERTIDSIYLVKPLTINIQPVSQQEVGLSFCPVLGSVEQEMTLQLPLHGLSIRPVKTNADVTANYIRLTTSLLTPGRTT
jgi:hypothetical protein